MTRKTTTSNILALGDNATLKQLATNLKAKEITLYCFNPLSIVPIDWKSNSQIAWQDIDKIIVVSGNAVIYGLNPIISSLKERTLLFAIGPETAAKIHSAQKVSIPTRYNSEALLELPALQNISGQKIVLFTGRDGRALLPSTLQKRGGILYTIECYESHPVITDLTERLRFWQANQVHQLIISSLASLQAFLLQVPEEWQDWLKQLTWIVPSARLEQALRDCGFNKMKRAEQFSVSAIQNILP